MSEALPLADELAALSARMSGLLLSERTVASALSLVTSLATETVPGTIGAGVTLVDERGGKTTAAATDALVERADSAQYELGEGPCLTAWAERTVVRVDDVATETRWPRWVETVRAWGLGAALSAPLVAGDTVLGAIKVYAGLPGAYGERMERLMTMFAAQAAVLLANARSSENARRLSAGLTEAMSARDRINIAKGMVMAREGVDEETAFSTLVDEARRGNERVLEVATRLTRTTPRPRR
jgi:GAF domain-containing protein